MTEEEARLMLSPDDVPLIQMLLADNGGTVVNAETWNVVKKSLPILFNQRAVLTAEVERMRTVVEAAVALDEENREYEANEFASGPPQSWGDAFRAFFAAVADYRALVDDEEDILPSVGTPASSHRSVGRKVSSSASPPLVIEGLEDR